ncbi:hypothetical protein ACQUSR_21155 [Streptomyces sp. P1-3]|uniref:hypothetical protein n=1 Tax=Streptomyces sp. P1-3 TaxID=3421658 RepID=UPI003D367026
MSRRSALRAAVASAALLGAVMVPAATASAIAVGEPVTQRGGGGQGPVLPVGTCVVSKEVKLGGGTVAVMLNTDVGPFASFKDGIDHIQLTGWLDRQHSKLPESAGFQGEILNADSAQPKLLVNLEGGGHKPGIIDFPKLPASCR